MPEGKLQCVHCGQTFLVEDGETIRINHFKRCPGIGGKEWERD